MYLINRWPSPQRPLKRSPKICPRPGGKASARRGLTNSQLVVDGGGCKDFFKFSPLKFSDDPISPMFFGWVETTNLQFLYLRIPGNFESIRSNHDPSLVLKPKVAVKNTP